MKSIIIALSLVVFSSLNINTPLQNEDCERNARFGEVEFCLSEIAGYKECYLEPRIKEIADATEVSTNVVLGYYLNDEDHDEFNSETDFLFDDYFKIYGTTAIENYKADKDFVKEIKEIVTSSFLVESWDELVKEVEGKGWDIEVGVPVVVKEYNLNEESFSLVMLVKYQFGEEEPYTVAMAINGILINERLVWMAYYLGYQDESTIAEVEENSNEIIKRLQESNK